MQGDPPLSLVHPLPPEKKHVTWTSWNFLSANTQKLHTRKKVVLSLNVSHLCFNPSCGSFQSLGYILAHALGPRCQRSCACSHIARAFSLQSTLSQERIQPSGFFSIFLLSPRRYTVKGCLAAKFSNMMRGYADGNRSDDAKERGRCRFQRQVQKELVVGDSIRMFQKIQTGQRKREFFYAEASSYRPWNAPREVA